MLSLAKAFTESKDPCNTVLVDDASGNSTYCSNVMVRTP
jgi:hypothetical protein